MDEDRRLLIEELKAKLYELIKRREDEKPYKDKKTRL